MERQEVGCGIWDVGRKVPLGPRPFAGYEMQDAGCRTHKS